MNRSFEDSTSYWLFLDGTKCNVKRLASSLKITWFYSRPTKLRDMTIDFHGQILGAHYHNTTVLEKLQHLKFSDRSNINATKLDPLLSLTLKILKCCNSKVSNRIIESFKEKHPECNVVYYR